MKKIFSLTITMIMLICVLTVCASALTYGDLTYTVSNGEVTITDCSTSVTSVTIPSAIKGYPVTSIGDEAFYNCTGLTSITIPDSVTSIGSFAFRNCTGLTSITIPDSVTSIGYGAFYNCTGLTSVTIGESVTSIGDEAFYNCTGLTSVTIPDSVTSIRDYAFSHCTGLTSITIPDSVTSIGYGAFYNCTGLTSVTIPDSVTSIGRYAFYNCTGLTSITIPDSVTSIGSSAFRNCTGLTQINWNAKNVADFSSSNYVFAYAGQSGEGINVIFGDNVERIPAYVFYSDSSYAPMIVSVTIGDSVTSIGSSAFSNCTGLTQINWNAKNVADFSSNNYVFVHAGQSGEGINVVFGDNVERIPAYVFCPYSDSSYAPKIVSVTIGDSVTSIGSSAFSNCTGLTSVTIPDSVTSIGSYAFENCSKLRRISFGSGLQTVGVDAFDGCTSLTKVNIPTINDWCEISFGDREGNPVYYTNDLYVNNILLESDITFPEGITSIGSYTFYDIPYLGDCILPNSLKKIGTGAFGNTISKIDDVYFQGSEDDWYTISIGTGNDALIDNPLYTDYYPSNPQIKYAINSVNVKDISGNSLTNIPETTFIAEIKVTNVASYTTNYILIATYDSDGRMLDIDFLYANPKVGQTVTFGTQIKNENGNVAKIKAFVISDLKSFNAVAEAVELVKV